MGFESLGPLELVSVDSPPDIPRASNPISGTLLLTKVVFPSPDVHSRNIPKALKAILQVFLVDTLKKSTDEDSTGMLFPVHTYFKKRKRKVIV